MACITERMKGSCSLPSQTILDAVARVTARRPKTVLDHILRYGSVSTDELTTLYGYGHAPRAARDVRELSIPLKTEMRTDSHGRRMAHYMFDDDEDIVLMTCWLAKHGPEGRKWSIIWRVLLHGHGLMSLSFPFESASTNAKRKAIQSSSRLGRLELLVTSGQR